jgi:hypothetical protein
VWYPLRTRTCRRRCPWPGYRRSLPGIVLLTVYASREPGQRWHNGRWITATGEVTDVSWAANAQSLPTVTMRLQCAEHGTFVATAFFPGIPGQNAQVEAGARVMVRVRSNDRTRVEVISVDGRALAERMRLIHG